VVYNKNRIICAKNGTFFFDTNLIRKKMYRTMYNVYQYRLQHIILLCAAGTCDSFSLYLRWEIPKDYIRIPVTNTTTHDGSLKRKGFLYSLWFFFFRPIVYLQPAQPPAGGLFPAFHSLNHRRTNPLHTHANAVPIRTNATQIPRLICSRVLGPVFMYTSLYYYYIRCVICQWESLGSWYIFFVWPWRLPKNVYTCVLYLRTYLYTYIIYNMHSIDCMPLYKQ